jgi:hypothetical protein
LNVHALVNRLSMVIAVLTTAPLTCRLIAFTDLSCLEEKEGGGCQSCGFTVDRDVNAARNILARGVRFAPVALPVEAMVQEPSGGNPESRWKRVNELRLHEPTS